MTLPIADNYQIKTSKTNHKVPVVNGIHLHSMYHPIREAENFISNHISILKSKNNILILGLGFVYHINQAIIELKKLYNDDFKIIVIEPNSQVANDSIALNLLIDKNVTILHGLGHNRLYQNEELISFLLEQPGIIAHPASFNLYKNYFKSFLQYKSPLTTEHVCISSKTDCIRDYFATHFPGEENIKLALHDYAQSNHQVSNSLDYLFFALNEIAPLEMEDGDKI